MSQDPNGTPNTPTNPNEQNQPNQQNHQNQQNQPNQQNQQNQQSQNLTNDGYATQEAYDEAAGETKDLVVPEGNQRFNVQQIPPFKFAALLEEYDLKDLGSQQNLQNLPDNVDTDDTDFEETLALVSFMKDVVVPNINRPSHAYWGKVPGWLLTDGSLQQKAAVAEQSGKPDEAEAYSEAHEKAEQFVQSLGTDERKSGVYPRQLPTALKERLELFDLSRLSTRDTMYLIGGITGQDPEAMLDEGLSAMEQSQMADEGDAAKFRR